MSFIITLVVLLSSAVIQASQSETAKTSVSREAYFQRAYKSMGFILLQAVEDPVFVNWLTPDEKQMLRHLIPIANSITTHNWLRDHKIEKIMTADNQQVYAYVVAGNHGMMVMADPKAQNDLVFSDDAKMFDLQDGKPERTAITEKRMGSPIYVNRKRINHPARPVTLGDAFLLMLHELGRKLGPREIETAVDSLGTKLKQFIDSQISTTELQGTQVHVLKFKKSNFEGWVNETIKLDRKLVNSEFPLSLFDLEGFYVFIEKENGVQDITDSVLQPITSIPLIEYDESDRLHSWHRLNWFNPQWVRITEKKPGVIELSVSHDQLQLLLPFLHNNSVYPAEGRPYNKIMVSSFRGARLSFIWDIDHSSKQIKVSNLRDGLIRLDDPSYDISLVSKEWQNQDLVFVYKINGKKEFRLEETSGFKMKITPELVLKFENKTFEVKSKPVPGKEDHYEFRLPDVKDINQGSIEVIGLEFGAEKVNITQDGANIRINTWLPTQEQAELEGSKRNAPVILKSLTIWDGRRWVPLASGYHEAIPRGSNLRFIFAAKEKLRSLEFTQAGNVTTQFTVYNTSDSGIRYEVATVTRETVGKQARITFTAQDMQQTLEGNTLVVDIEVDKVVDLEAKISARPTLPMDLRQMLQDPNAEVEQAVKSGDQRSILRVKTVSESLSITEIPLKNILHFTKSNVESPEANSSRKASRSSEMRCEHVLNRSVPN